MELTELVSPHIAVPVIGVVVCAIMVFAFGFRSPVQPPSFNFEEEKRSKRRTKQTKPKGNVNGQITANDQASEVAVPKVTSKPSKEVKAAVSPKPASSLKPAASPKAELNEPKNVTKKELKQDNKGDKKGKSKKELVKEDLKAEGGKKNKAVPAKKETEDDGEWTTIQVSKKSKKQKPISKKEIGQAESAVEPESETENTPVQTYDAAAASSAILTSEVQEFSSARARKTKKKEAKLPAMSRAEGKEESLTVHEAPESLSNLTLNQDQDDVKRKKSKKDKKSPASGADAAASASENIIQDVAASGKAVKKKLSPTPVVSAQFSALVNTEQAKPTAGKKKSKGKENIQEEKIVKTAGVQLKEREKPADPVKKDADVQLKEVEKPVAVIKKDVEKKKAKTLSKALRVDSEISAAPLPPVESAAGTADPVPVGISFDEIGDSWQEAAPKSKKKKPRKDN